MKKITKLCAVFVVLLLFSCGNDDSNVLTGDNSIVGKWYLYSKEENGKIEVYEDGTCGKSYLEITKNEVKKINFECQNRINRVMTYEVKGNKVYLKHKSGKTGVVRYELKGNRLIIYDNYSKGSKEVYIKF